MASWSAFSFGGWDPLASIGEYELAGHYNRHWMRDQYKLAIQGMKEAPSARVEGLRAAGLNPILAAGSAGSGSVDVSSNPLVQDSQASGGSMDDLLALKFGKKQRQAQIDLLKSQEARQKADASAATMNAESNQWQILNANELKESGLKFGIDIGGKFQEVNAVRINKVTGQCFDLKGRQLSPAAENSSSPAPSKPQRLSLLDAFKVLEDKALRRVQTDWKKRKAPSQEAKDASHTKRNKKGNWFMIKDNQGNKDFFTEGKDGELYHRRIPWRGSRIITY